MLVRYHPEYSLTQGIIPDACAHARFQPEQRRITICGARHCTWLDYQMPWRWGRSQEFVGHDGCS
jgi:hypothetical protein